MKHFCTHTEQTVSYNTSTLMLYGQVAGADCENYTGNIFCGDHVEILGDTSVCT